MKMTVANGWVRWGFIGQEDHSSILVFVHDNVYKIQDFWLFW